MNKKQNITFFLGDNEHTLPDDVTPETTLNQYLRERLYLTGTKRMCLEGGCGCCVVAVEQLKPKKGEPKIFVVNSCLVSIFSCHGWKIHTIEGLGGPLIGYNKLQTLLAKGNGTQCGFCSCGMVMNMFALTESGKLTEKQIENSFGGNICRCTGYRPILQSFKTLASDDIEDYKPCNRSCDGCEEPCAKLESFSLSIGKTEWIKVHYLADLIQTLATVNLPYMLVAGNTARGVYKHDPIRNTYIDIANVKELTSYTATDNYLVLGGSLSLTQTMNIFYDVSKKNPKFSYLSKIADHIDLVAHIPVRNIGTLAGNLMIKHNHREFPSDIFLTLETADATITVIDTDEKEVKMSPWDFMKYNMERKVLKSITLKGYDNTYTYCSYKIMPRAQNAHAMVNAGFLLKLKNNSTVQSARIVYGGINPQFAHAKNTEKFLLNQNLFDNNTLQKAYDTLNNEVQPDYFLPDPTPEYRKNLAISLFYKFVLSIAPNDKISSRHKSGGKILDRPVSSGTQEFSTQKDMYPVSEPIIKLEALAQTSGQAQYVEDIPDLPNQLHAAFVTAKAPAGSTITSIDATPALKVPGVVSFMGKDDIPGRNVITPKSNDFPVEEPLFCNGTVLYYDQSVGIVLATTEEVAVQAAELVIVNFTPSKNKPLLLVQDVLKAPADVQKERITHETAVVPKRKGTDTKTVVKGDFYIGLQYHFHMEVQCCAVMPTEDGLVMFPSTQWADSTQLGSATVLGIPCNKIYSTVKRLGGSFGAKILRNTHISAACSLAAYKLRRPVRMRTSLEKNMAILGKRYPLYMRYEAGINDKGVIQYLNAELYSDFGANGGNEPNDFMVVPTFENCYVIDTWTFDTFKVKTDKPSNCWTRAPGTTEGLAAIESLMEHLAYTINMDASDFKLANFNQTKFPKLLKFYKELLTWADVAKRKQEIQKFNEANRWIKRGMSVVPMAWSVFIHAAFITVVSIYHGDGSVAIAHGGIEMGQGINTKIISVYNKYVSVAQVCAYTLGIPLDMVAVKATNTLANANSYATGGSVTTESVCYSTIKACKILQERMKPIKDKMNNPTWIELVQQCYTKFVPLSASTDFKPDDSPEIKEYIIYGVAAAEVEVDILTGQKMVHRVDIIEDVGDSMNPLLDIGQVEGAFVMGLGYHTLEEIIYNEEGKIMTDRTWNYKPPGAKDIPVDFRIKFPSNNPNNVGVLHSKATAEPPLCLSVSIPLAIRNAVASARQDSDKSKPKWYPFEGCSTVENTFLHSLNNYTQYNL